MKWHYVGPIDAEDAVIRKVRVAGKNICLIKYQNQYFALNSKCPHAGADLSTGWCENGKLVCPFHRYAFDLATGRGSPGQNDYVDTYPIEVTDGDVYVGIRSFWDWLG